MKLALIIVLLVSISLVLASVTVEDVDVERDYAPGGFLRGNLNISLSDESAKSLLTAFDSQINILDFLEAAGADYTCSPNDCQSDYLASNGELSKTFSLSSREEKILGLKITGDIESIGSFSMDITSDIGETGYPALFVDILNDDEILDTDWRVHNSSGNFGDKVYGCYDSPTGQAEITTEEYCEKITLFSAANVELGAEVTGDENVDFDMIIYNDDEYESCTAEASGSGEISCVAELDIFEEEDYFVCIKVKSSADDSKYSIGYEQNNPCGFVGEFEEYEYDFNIFAKPGYFSPIGTTTINNDEISDFNGADISDEIEDYLAIKYGYNCEDGCVIPIEFKGGPYEQEITLSSVTLSYVAGIATSAKNLYDVTEEEAKIDMELQSLDLEDAELKVPEEDGEHDVLLKLGDEELFDGEIEVLEVAIIDRVIPLEVPAAMSVRFLAFISGDATEYEWDFGDGTEEITLTNSTYHSYPSIGTYNLTLTVSNIKGEVRKEFSVVVKSPEAYINNTLDEKKDDLNELKEKLSEISGWYKEEIEKKLNLVELEDAINNLERDYEKAITDEDYVKIMTDLNELNIPNSIKVESSSGELFPDDDYIDPSYLIELVGEIDNPYDYANSIVNWMNDNVKIKVDKRNYKAVYAEGNDNLLTYFKLKIEPKEDIYKESHLIIDKGYEELIFKENYNQKAVGFATAISFSELEKDKEESIEFIWPEEIEIIELPLYLSPEFDELPEPEVKISPCDYDGKCEKSEGETVDNCPSDCKSLKKPIIYILILLFVAFWVYIAMQEWYKRYYEKHLFKNKNDLFNLVNFINNALHQGLSKREIISKLKKHGWKNEQIVYALKKVKGKRTGMWEIPIFKFLEKKKVKEEIAKRQKLGMKGIQYPPRQLGVFGR